MCDLIRLDNALAQSAEGYMTTAAGMRVANDFCGVGDDVWVCLRKRGEEEEGRRGGRSEMDHGDERTRVDCERVIR